MRWLWAVSSLESETPAVGVIGSRPLCRSIRNSDGKESGTVTVSSAVSRPLPGSIETEISCLTTGGTVPDALPSLRNERKKSTLRTRKSGMTEIRARAFCQGMLLDPVSDEDVRGTGLCRIPVGGEDQL